MSNKIQTISDIRKCLIQELSSIYPPREIRSITDIILKTSFNTDRLHHLSSGQAVSDKVIMEIKAIAAELRTGKPLQYVLGQTIFYDCVIKVTGDTLIPRPETEELVHLMINENKEFKGRILDIGTGSGCIAIALAKNLPGAAVTAIDNSGKALALAATNAEINNVNIEFIKKDMLEQTWSEFGPFGIIASNPPYVRESEKKAMHRNVLDFEPPGALFVPDSDPLLFYRAILKAAGSLLEKAGRIYFEINEMTGGELKKLMAEYGFARAEIHKDINGKNRIISGIHHD